MECQDYTRVAEFLGFVKGICAAFVALGLGAAMGYLIAVRKKA